MKHGTSRCISRGKYRAILILLATLFAVFASCLALAESRDTVRIAGSAWVGDAPTWVADRQGLFNRGRPDDAPIIEVDRHGSGLEALMHLLAGEAQFALAATTPTAMALIGALDGDDPASSDLVVLGSVALSNQSHYVIAPSGNGIDSPQDLAGKRVGVMFGTSSHYGWSRFSGFHGLDVAGVELIDTPVAAMAEALQREELDAAVIWQPWDLALREALDDEVTILPMRMLYTANWLLLSSREFVATQPEVVKRVLGGYITAIDMIDAKPERAMALHAEATGRDGADLLEPASKILWRLGMNWSVLVNLGTQFEWLATWPQFDALTIPEPGQYLHGEPLRQVAPERVTLPGYLLTSGVGKTRP